MIKKFLLITVLFSSCYLYSQRTVSGTVKDNSDFLPGVSVIEKGTKNGAVTDFNGNFKIKVTKDDAILIFSYMGYKTLEESVENKIKMVVVLEESAEELDEIVINALGYKVDKNTLGATVTTLKAEDIETSGEINIINALQGKASGVRIARPNGDPGAGSIIQIRGANTISGNSQPLIILDGVPISNDNFTGNIGSYSGTSQQSRLNDISEDDIETINILKGASAAATWGSQAANGVIVITTKSGKNTGRLKIRYRSTYYVDQISEIHPLQNTFGQGTEGVFGNTTLDSFSWGDRISKRSGAVDDFYTKAERGFFKDQNGREWLRVKNKNSKETFTDANFDHVFQTGFSLKQFVNVSNANDSGSYYLSFGKTNQEGIVRNSDYNKTSLYFSGRYKFSKKLKSVTRINYINTTSNRVIQGSSTSGLLVGLLRTPADFDSSGYYGEYTNSDGVVYKKRQRSYRNPIGASSNPGYNNPLWVTNKQLGPQEMDRVIMSSQLDYKATDWLSLKLRGSFDSYFDERRYFFPKYSAGRGVGQFKLDNINRSIANFDIIGTTKTFKLKDNLKANFLLGYNHNSSLRKSVYNSGSNFILNSDAQTFFNTKTIEIPRHYITRERKYRVFYTAGFEYKNQFFVNTTGALEKSSTINGAFFYPSIDASWIFSKLEAFDTIKFVNTGKLRFGVGQVGVEPRAHRAQTTYETPTYSGYGDPLELKEFGGGYRYNNNLGNANLKPELKTEYEIGADLKLFNKRVTIGGTYYYNEVKDVLVRIPLSISSGAGNIYGNGAKIRNKGLEVEFEYDFIKIKKGLTASLYGNYNNNENKVLEIKGTNSIPLTSQTVSSRAVVGYSVGTLWGSKAKRLPDGTFDLDANGFPQLAEEQGVLGDPYPDWRGAAGLKLNYKNFSANIMFETSQGGVFAERTRFVLGNFGTHADVGKVVTPDTAIKDRTGFVHPAGVEVRGNIKDFGGGPVLLNEAYYTTIGGGFGSSVINEFSINQDASWTRLSEVTLGYSLKSKKFREKTKLSSISVSVTARNLALWTDILGIDPQTNQSGVSNGFGIDYFTNPGTKTYLLSLNIRY